jgi:MSHA biogenesis protein MshO
MRHVRAAGVTLIELVVTIVILAILAVAATAFLKPALDAYFDTQRRAALVDVVDTASRRMMRDIRLALPNSVRIDGTNRFVEILLTKNGGRYRASNDASVLTTEDPLDFTAADTNFDTLGCLPTGASQRVAANDLIVIHNLGLSGANAYDTGAAAPNFARVATYASNCNPGPATTNEDRITLTAANRFPLESPGRRFFVVSGPVTFACENIGIAGGNGTGTLRRWGGYAIALNGGEPRTVFPGGAGSSNALLADSLSACSIRYETLAFQARGLVEINLQMTRANETVTLHYEAHVNNVP